MANIEDWLDIEVVDCHTPSEEELAGIYLPQLFYEDKKGREQIDENVFAEYFRDLNNLTYSNGLFYSNNGRKSEEMVAKDIYDSLKELGYKQNMGQQTKKLLDAVKLASTVASLEVNQNVIPFANGDFYVNEWKFHSNEYGSFPYRLGVPLSTALQDTPNFEKWLHDLFYEEDILTIWEYLGYCLVPTTRAQKALFLVGEGGAGKSVMGVILESILGDALLSTPNSQEFMTDKFKLGELQHRLVLYDDDLSTEALKDTGLYKKLITNTINISADRKYAQSFKFKPYVKLVSCCNEMLSSVYDNTGGFFRRLLPIKVKPVAADFKPDLQFYDKIRAEREGIVQWALAGLHRLVDRNWELSQSERSAEYLTGKQSIGNPFPGFMQDVFDFGEGKTTTNEIMKVYKAWCKENSLTPKSDTTLQKWLVDNKEKYQLVYSTNVPIGNGKRVRGYIGLSVKKEWSYTGLISLK